MILTKLCGRCGIVRTERDRLVRQQRILRDQDRHISADRLQTQIDVRTRALTTCDCGRPA
jgi:hypothetical protein